MLSMGPVFRFKLKGREWNLLSLDNEAEGGAREGGEDWLKSGGVSVSDLAGSSPTAEEKPETKTQPSFHADRTNQQRDVSPSRVIFRKLKIPVSLTSSDFTCTYNSDVTVY